jgi:cell division protein FtsB
MRLPSLGSFGPSHVVLAVAALFLALFLYSAVQTAAQTYRLHEERRSLTYEIDELRRQRAELQGLREYLASDEYLETVARTQFGLVRPGESAVLVDGPTQPQPERAAGQRWWEALFAR